MPYQWYALRSKPRKEDLVWRQLRLESVEVFYPRLRVNPVNPRSRKIKPYFPGYLFVHLDLDQTGVSRFQFMPHTLGLVSFGGEPAYVPENLIIELQKRVTEIAEAGGEVLDGLRSGDTVRISSGPFKDFEAIFDARVPGSERVRVLLELLSNRRQVSIELPVGTIEKKRK
jgi:transcriptional antiterminator RfaH